MKESPSRTASSWLMALADPLLVPGNGDLADRVPARWQSLAGGIVELSRGQTGRAIRTLEDEYRHAADARDGERAVLALSLGWLAEVRHFNFFPGGCGAGSVEVELRWNGVERANASQARLEEARTWPGATDVRYEYRWLQFLAARQPALAIIRDAAGHPMRPMLLTMNVQQCEGVRDDARRLHPEAVGFVERSIAELQAMAGDRAIAGDSLERAIAAYRAAKDNAGAASCVAMRAQWAAAPFSSALVRNLMVADAAYPTSELTWVVEAGEGVDDGADPAAARSSFEEARALYEQIGCPRGAAAAILGLAYTARVEGQLDRQIELAEEAEQRFQAAGDHLHANLAKTHALLARLDARRFPEDRAAAAAIGAWGAADGSFSYALGLGLLFTRAGRQALLREGDYEKAESCYELAAALNRALGARCRESQTHADLAALHQALGNRQRSQAHLEDAIEALIPAADRQHRPPALVLQRAALLVQQAYREALDHRDAAGMELAIRRLPTIEPPADDLAGSTVAAFVADTREQAPVLIALYKGIAERNAGNEAASEALYGQALAHAADVKSSDGRFLEAVVHATARRFSEAVDAYDRYGEAGAQGSGLTAALISAIGKLSDLRGRQEIDANQRRLIERRFSFMVRARAYERAAADLHLLQQVAGAEWWKDDDRPWRSLSDIAEMHEGLEQLPEALAVYEQAIDELEQRRSLLSRDELKTALAADLGVQYLYFQAVRAALKLARAIGSEGERRGMQQQAFALSERARARALLDLLAANIRGGAGSGDEPEAFRRWRQLSAAGELWRGMLARARAKGESSQVEALRARIEAGEQELYELEQSLNTGSRQSLPSSAAISTIDETAARLPEGAAMLQYMSLGDELLVWAITRSGMSDAAILDVRAHTLGRIVRECQAGCARGMWMDLLEKPIEQLSTWLLDPVASAIADHERLIITPYGELNVLPFGALRWNGRWLGHQRALSCLPSASMLEELSPRPSRAPHPILIVGNPTAMAHQPPFGPAQPLPALEHAEAEAQSIGALYQTTPLINGNATIEEVRPNLRTNRQLHFATHGVLYDEAPLLSGIALANGYVLTVQELMGLRLDADLVIVSACKSGLGARTGGEEIVGLTRGLLAAGARAVVVSLWPVLDLSTALLMVNFHQNLREGASVSAALQRAQIWLSALSTPALEAEQAKLRDLAAPAVAASRSMSHPQHWAPFVVIGA